MTATLATPALEAAPAIEAMIVPDAATVEQDAATDYETRAAALRAAWNGTTTLETEATAALAAALWNRGAARVVKARVAYAAGVLGSKTDAPTAAGAVRVLEAKKATLQPYWKTGQLLANTDGVSVESVLPPTAAEIAIAATVFDAVNESNKATKGNASKATTDTDTEDTDTDGGAPATTKAPADSPVLLADVLAAMEALAAMVTDYAGNNGFTSDTADAIADVLQDISNTVESVTVRDDA